MTIFGDLFGNFHIFFRFLADFGVYLKILLRRRDFFYFLTPPPRAEKDPPAILAVCMYASRSSLVRVFKTLNATSMPGLLCLIILTGFKL